MENQITLQKKVGLSVILPSFQEEENLRLLLPRIIENLNQLECVWEVLVIDTMKPLDSTNILCDSLKVKYIPRENGNSYGDAIVTGINRANGEYTIIMDSDGSHSPEWLSVMYAKKENDIVIASRYVEMGSTENNFALIVMSRVLNITYSLILGIRCKDVSNSFRLYRTNLLKEITLKCKNFDIVQEILYKIIKNNLQIKIHEVPFTFKQRLFGKTKRNLFLFILTYIFTLIKLRFLM